jgi:hypothetical protein
MVTLPSRLVSSAFGRWSYQHSLSDCTPVSLCMLGVFECAHAQTIIVVVGPVVAVVIIIISSSSSSMDVFCHRSFLPGTSLEPAVNPTAQASSFTPQYFPYYV